MWRRAPQSDDVRGGVFTAAPITPRTVWARTRSFALRVAETFFRPLTLAFLLLTAVVFSGPVILLAAPAVVPVGSGVVSVFVGVLVAVDVVAFLVVTAFLVRSPLPGRFARHVVVVAAVLSLSNAARLGAGLRWGGLGAVLAQAGWFAAPLGLWWLASRRGTRGVSPSWVPPLRWMPAAFSLALLLAELSRSDLQPYTGSATPAPAAWLFAYGPTLIATGMCLAGWWTFEVQRTASTRSPPWWALLTPIAGAVSGVLVSAHPLGSFVASATVTWGSGYQLFRTPDPLPPLAGAFVLVGISVAAYVRVLVRVRPENRVAMLVAFAVVLSGVYATPASVLGSLLAVQLLWLVLMRSGEGSRRDPAPGSASGGQGRTPAPIPRP